MWYLYIGIADETLNRYSLGIQHAVPTFSTYCLQSVDEIDAHILPLLGWSFGLL
jgi:hypothetical protein